MFGIRVHSPGQIDQHNKLSNNGPHDVTPILQTVPIDGLVGLIISILPVDIENVPHSRTDSGPFWFSYAHLCWDSRFGVSWPFTE